MTGTRDFGALAGRILLALIFVLSGFEKLMGPAGTMKMMAAHGLANSSGGLRRHHPGGAWMRPAAGGRLRKASLGSDPYLPPGSSR